MTNTEQGQALVRLVVDHRQRVAEIGAAPVGGKRKPGADLSSTRPRPNAEYGERTKDEHQR